MDVATKDGRIYRRRMITHSKLGTRAAIKAVYERGFEDYIVLDLGTATAVYFDPEPSEDDIEDMIAAEEQAIEDGQARWSETGSTRRR